MRGSTNGNAAERKVIKRNEQIFRILRLGILAGPCVLLSWVASQANDNLTEIAAGGIKISGSTDIDVLGADLYISPSQVRVDYTFRNKSDKDVETIVSFPMPSLNMNPYAMQTVKDPKNQNFMHFTASQDGKVVEPKLDQRVFLGTVDYTYAVSDGNIPIFALPQKVDGAIQTSSKQHDKWVELGLAMPDAASDSSANDLLYPSWTLHITYWWKTIFPAGKTVKVHHSYVPNVGRASTVSIADESKDRPRLLAYQSKYCLDDDFIRKAKAISNQEGLPDGAVPTEKWLSYILFNGGNWQGGRIGRYHLTIDKERPQDIVSFCGDGVKKTGPTTFEIEATDFDPSRNIDVLIVGGFVP